MAARTITVGLPPGVVTEDDLAAVASYTVDKLRELAGLLL